MPKEGDKMNGIKKGWIILALILLIETIPYGILKGIIIEERQGDIVKKKEKIEKVITPQPIRLEGVSDINDRIENFLDFVYPLVVWITLAIANLKLKSKRLKWVIYGMGVLTFCIWVAVWQR